MTDPRPARASRTRTLMIIGIVVFGALGVYLQFRLAAKRDAAEQAALDRPEARAMKAMSEADRATLDGDHRAAWAALETAAAALDDALADRPDAPDLLRGRLVVARRLARQAEHPSISTSPLPLYRDALARAEALFDRDGTDEQARLDRLGAARELADHLMNADKAAEAAQVARIGAEAIEASARIVPPGSPVIAALGELWLVAARAHAAAGQRDPALGAARSAITNAEAGRTTDDDPLTVAARAYNTAAAAVEIAEQLDASAEAEAFEREAIRLLEGRQRMQPDDLAIRRTLAVRRVRLADHDAAAERFDAALANHEAALALRRELLQQYPADQSVRRDVVRGLNQLGAFHSERDRDNEALAAYAEAAAIGKTLDDEGLRTRIIAMGNHAQLLGRVDKTREARDVAADAYALAVERADALPSDREATIDAARAGLRYARLLRAPPGANRDRARTVARAARDRLDRITEPGKRGADIDEALDELLRELR